MNISTLLNQITKWANKDSNIDSALLVGSHAKNEAREDSDIDIVIVCDKPNILIENPHWIQTFGEVDKYELENWGLVTSIRTFYKNGQEVEFGITSKKWTAMPVDEGTKKVISDGASILIDKSGALKRIL